jgi:lipid A 3-O-deacylase
LALGTLALSALSSGAYAGPKLGGVITLVDENDTFTNTDRNYTNGVKIGYVQPPEHTDALGTWIKDHLWPDSDAHHFRNSYSLGQSMFTPRDLSMVAPQPLDRPYAGWLYGGYGLIAESDTATTTAELELGVVGPSAGAKWVQQNFHKLINGAKPKGWDNQIEDRFGADLTVMRQWYQHSPSEWHGIQLEIEPHVGATVGDVTTEAFAGASLVIGNDLTDDSLPMRVRPSLAGSGSFDVVDGIGWFLFAGAQVRAVAYDVFLEGETPYKSLIDWRPYVLDAQAGAALRLWRAQLTFTLIERTKEFDQQSGNDRFGALSLSWHL